MLEFLAAIALTWPIFALAAMIVFLPARVFRRRRGLETPARAFVLLPWLIWAAIFLAWAGPKSLATAVIDATAVGIASGTAAVVASLLPRHGRRLALLSASVIAMAVALLVPFIGE